jgi:hypothetical protein
MAASKILLSVVSAIIVTLLISTAGCSQPPFAARAQPAAAAPGALPIKTYKDLVVGDRKSVV